MKGIPGVITQDGRYVEKLVIPCYQTDSGTKLRPAAFMDIAQEVAFRAANVMGFGWDNLIPDNLAWVLSRMHFRYTGKLSWRDEADLVTWNRGPYGPFYLRDFRLQGDEGSIVCTSSWVLLDLKARMLCRHAPLLDTIPGKYQCDDAVLEEPAEKIQIPRDAEHELVREHEVGYSDIDFLGHTNNARYMVWAMECLDPRMAKEYPKDVYINFLHETKAGDRVALWRIVSGSSAFVEGKVGEETSFTVRIDY